MATVPEQLLETLDELDQEKLKRFKWHLKQDGSFSADELKNADVIDTVDKMVEHFGAEEAVKITQEILRKMNHNQLAEQLENKHREEPSTTVVVSSPVCSEISFGVRAETGASVNAPFISGNTFTGPVQILHKDKHPPTVQEPARKHTREQGDSVLHKFLQHFCPYQTEEFVLRKFLKHHKANMKQKTERIFESRKKRKTLLKNVYTELFITEGDTEELNQEHENQKTKKCVKQKSHDKPINYNDIFCLLGQNKNKTVLTKGIAGIGKTFSVHKFILDWAEGKANQNIDAMFLLPFREINLIKDGQISFHEFLLEFYPEMKELNEMMLYECKLLFIFDGLDESRLPLNFKSRIMCSVIERTSIDELFTNLVKGNLLPSALIWITSRPAAANQIPLEHVDLFTEVRGFTDQQKEEYFRKRFKDQTMASKMISHIKTSRSLYIMCHIPVFCWIAATVLHEILIKNNGEDIHTTLTEMYIHFLLIQMNMKNQKYEEKEERERTKLLDSNKTIVLKLAKLAFDQLKKENTMFCEEDLKECGIDVSEDSKNIGMITEMFKKEAGLHEMKVFCFVHQSVQEFLAALHVFFCYMIKNVEELSFFFEEQQDYILLHDLLKKAINKAAQSQRGHLDHFLRFLLGISLESNQKLLKGLLTDTEDSKESIKNTIEYIKLFQNKHIASENSMNLTLCLSELKDYSLFKEIQTYGSADVSSERELSSSMCSALAYMIFMSGDVLDEFDPKLYETSPAGYLRLISAMRCCRKALFGSCGLTDTCCEIVASSLQSSKSPLRELDLSNNDLQDSGVKLISDALKSHNCQLHILRLSGCMVTEEGCCYLASALSSNPSHLRELDLSYNHPGHSGVQLLSERLNHPDCTLETLNLDHGGESRITPGLKKYSCYLTLDSNTVDSRLVLSEGNRMVNRVKEKQPYPDHPERFDYYGNVLCKESLTGRCYWEAEWTGVVDIPVVYKGLKRKGDSNECYFGYNEKSWTLYCTNRSYSAIHNKKSTDISTTFPSKRVGVYLDWSAGTLSFYSVSDTHTLTHLHTFNTTFTEPLYAGFGVYPGSSVCLL